MNDMKLFAFGSTACPISSSATIAMLVGIAVCLQGSVTLTADDSTTISDGERVPWTTSRIVGTPDAPPPYQTQRVYPAQEFEFPTSVIPVPMSDRLIVAQLLGKVISFSTSAQHEEQHVALDLNEIHPDVAQTLGIVFHRDYPSVPICYVTYSVKGKSANGVRLARFDVTDTALPVLDPASEAVIATWHSGGHKGGCMRFGPDGYLYVAIGDGSPPNPPDGLNTGQDISDLQGSILRIDIDRQESGLGYAIPPDNPFVDVEGARGEVWAYGFRNPWKFCFDEKSGDLWTGDVGWELIEMVYRVEKGGNYGWSIKEGSQNVHIDGKPGPTPILPPIVEYSHIEGRSVTGGFFYQGDRLPELQGSYLYGDYITGKIWALRYEGDRLTWHQEIADTPLKVITFTKLPDGEVLVIDYEGSVHRLVRNQSAAANSQFPRLLSETGLFSSVDTLEPAAGVIGYDIRAEHWADHTTAQRVIGLPDHSRLSVFQENQGELGHVKGYFSFPDNAVLAKTVLLEMSAGDPESNRRVETQILHRNGDAWQAYNYIWNDDQTDAILAENEGVDRRFLVSDPDAPRGVREQIWHHSSRDECLLFHIWKAGTVHGFKLDQLDLSNSDHANANQIERFRALGFFADSSLPEPPRQVSPHDQSASLDDRARAYLHLNCAHCHRRGGGGTAAFDIRQELQLGQTGLLDTWPTQGDFGIADARIIASADPYRSLLYYRMAKLGKGHMPHFGSNEVDERGLQLVHDWIASLPKSGDSNEGTGASSSPPSNSVDARAGDEALKAAIQTVKMGEPPETLDSALSRLFASPRATMVLLHAMTSGEISRVKHEWIAERAALHSAAHARDLLERFLPADRRVKRLGTSFDVDELLRIEGDRNRGEELFLSADGISCRNCHQIKGKGMPVGPDLSEVGSKYSKGEILENIIKPSSKIDPAFITHILMTVDGQVITGVLKEQTESSVKLADASGKEWMIEREEIDAMQSQNKSIMPELMLQDFTAEQAADLLAYLSSLKK